MTSYDIFWDYSAWQNTYCGQFLKIIELLKQNDAYINLHMSGFSDKICHC